jgi:imidazolonepropionase-like amidohydrolase
MYTTARQPLRLLCAFVCAVLPGALACGADGRADLLIEDVWVIDATGRDPYRGSICIAGGRIRDIADPDEHSCTGASEVIPGEGGYLIPGLWDMHVHLAEDEARPGALDTLLAHGVTTVRDMGGRFEVLERWRRESRAGERAGPDLILVGPTINGPGDDSYHLEAGTRADGAAAVDSVATLGVDQVKVHRLLPRDAFVGVLEEAHRRGLLIVGHVPHGVSALEACELGMAEIAHLSALLEAAVMRADEPAAGIAGALSDLAGQRGRRTYECIAARGGAITPNLVAYVHAGRIAGPEAAELTRRLVDRLGDVVMQMNAAGVVLMTASDAPGEHNEIPWGLSVHEEMELLVAAGLAPLQAISAATAAPARFTARYDDVGTIETGKQADLLLLRANPLENIAATRDLRWIVSNGRLIQPR